MELKGRTIVVTGGASGMGRAMVRRFADEAPNGLVVVDLDEAAATAVARRSAASRSRQTWGTRPTVLHVVDEAERAYGHVDVWCSNAGIAGPSAGPEAPDGTWQRLWDVHVMAHVWAARALLPACSSAARATCSTRRRPPAC